MMLGVPPSNRDRFLAAIAERVPPDRVQAVFLFAPMRQGPVETGVAVLAVDPIPVIEIPAHVVEPEGTGHGVEGTVEGTGHGAAGTELHSAELQSAELPSAELPSAELQSTEQQGGEQQGEGQGPEGMESAAEEPFEADPDIQPDAPSPMPRALPDREQKPVVLTARYRSTLKGPERGKWELEILEQADAPMITIERVIQGVQQRLADSSDPERLGADALRAALADGVWTPAQR